MATRWRYRITTVTGTAALTVAALWVANLSVVQETFSLVPYFGRPAPAVLSNGDLTFAASTTLVVVLAAMWPVFKPRPRRILDAILLTQKRVLLAMVALAALGYYNYTYRLPRPTLMVTTLLLLFVLPAWTVSTRQRPNSSSRAVIVGDDPEAMEAILKATDVPILGYVSPPSSYATDETREVGPAELTDGGAVERRLDELSNLGGLSRLDEVFIKHDVDTALLAFAETDREEFFGTLAECYEHGVTAQAHRDHADSVLTDSAAGGEIVEIDLEPWDWQDHVAKRAFDVAFSLSALLALSPLVLCIAALIKADSPGPVLYAQERTAEFGDTFTVYKFRSMVTGAEAKTGVKLSDEDRGDVDPRVTRVGRILRATHLDEIPQLWSILVGDMSVVGPRPERPELDNDIEMSVGEWRRRWFVRPGLTGLAQINGATGHQPAEKLRYDIEYIRQQSFWFDLKVVIRQLWLVGVDAVGVLSGDVDE
jgi:lipopolysaccharide/colanic/teichoic acid biosynthesis glycosyltransferase